MSKQPKGGHQQRSHPQQSPDPSPAEIRQLCQRFQSRWSAGERARRQQLHATAWEVPRVDTAGMSDGVTADD